MKTTGRFFGLHFCCRQYGANFNHGDVIGPKATEFSEIMQNNGHYAVQGHSRILSLVPMESDFLYVCHLTSYLAPFPRYGGLLVQFPLLMGCLSLMHLFGVKIKACKIWPQGTRNTAVSYSVKCIRIS